MNFSEGMRTSHFWRLIKNFNFFRPRHNLRAKAFLWSLSLPSSIKRTSDPIPTPKSYQFALPANNSSNRSIIWPMKPSRLDSTPKRFLNCPRGIEKAADWMKPFTTELEIKFTKNPSWKVPSKVKMHPIKKLAICAKNGDDTPLQQLKTLKTFLLEVTKCEFLWAVSFKIWIIWPFWRPANKI